MRVLAIVPAFNEERSLPAVVAGLRRSAPGVDVCVVDDGSTDGTAAAARSLGVTLLSLPVNLGIGGAVQAGYRWARDQGYDVAVQVDGDGQHDAGYLPALVEEVASGRADLAVGSRFAGPRVAGAFRSTWSRRAGIRYLSAMLRLRCGARVSDPTSGFRAAGRPRHRALRPQLPSRLPGARVDRRGRPGRPPGDRGPGPDERAAPRGELHRPGPFALLPGQGLHGPGPPADAPAAEEELA